MKSSLAAERVAGAKADAETTKKAVAMFVITIGCNDRHKEFVIASEKRHEVNYSILSYIAWQVYTHICMHVCMYVCM